MSTTLPISPAEAQRLADQDPRAVEAAERQSEAERLGISEQTGSPRVREQSEASEEAIDTDDDDEDLDEDNQDTGTTDAQRLEQSENVEPSPGDTGDRAVAEKKALERGLEIRDFGTAGDWRVYDPKTGKMASKQRLEEPIK